MNSEPTRVLLVGRDPQLLDVFATGSAAASAGAFAVVLCERLGQAPEYLRADRFDAVVLDLELLGGQGLDAFASFHANASGVPVVVLAGEKEEELARQAVGRGAKDYLLKSEGNARMLPRVLRYLLDHERAAEQLREREEFFWLISEGVTDLIAVVDAEGRRLYNSPSYKDLLGDVQALCGTNSFAEIHPEDRERIVRLFRETLATGIGHRSEYRFLLKDGTIRFIESQGSVIRDRSGKPSKILVVSRDMTARKHAEQLLATERYLLRTLIDNLPDYIYFKDTESRFVMNNLAHVQVLGASTPEQVVGQTDFNYFPRELAEQYRADERVVLESGQALCNREEPVVDPAGNGRWVLTTKAPLKDSSGKIWGLVGMSRDITERKLAEERLRQANAELAQSEEALRKALERLKASHDELQATQLQLIQSARLECIGTLAAGVAHEVKNPLQIILMGLAYLTDHLRPGDENLSLALHDMQDAVRRADSIVRELLQLSAATPVEMKEQDFNATIERALRLVNYEMQAARITLVRELCADLPPVRLDWGKMEQVLINLLINARQAMPEGGTLTVRTRMEHWLGPALRAEDYETQFRPGDRVVVAELHNTGVGIPEKDLARIFDPFYTTKPLGVGTGLGLSVVKKIIDLHRGTIEIKNATEGGVRVTLRLNAQPTKP